ncbi:SMI1/KNR4 family protein [Nocardiopsis sp. CC223A]|uniref:SMI1/KNR4 family protein n=1 Tax=Nocardiopsis sp. CC223A TaxID=3044051 RepID=UPI00278C5D13|nr:SMI1/KNR4 family protein [Nocardiopsis sp. CC223A]
MTHDDDAVFEAVRARVFSGEYLDHRLGLPEDDRVGAARCCPDQGSWRTVYFRGTPEYDTALAAGRLDPPPPLKPVEEEAVKECEEHLGRPLPPLLRRCYLELGDGGFGPGYGLLPLWDPENGVSVMDAFRQREGWPREWRPMADSLLTLCDWGCGIESLVDCRNPSGGMWAIDPNSALGDDPGVMLFPQEFTFPEWMRRWVDGTLRQPQLLLGKGAGG